MNSFEKGYQFFSEQAGPGYGALVGDQNIQQINEAIEKLQQHLLQYENDGTPVAQLKGNVFEWWQADTFNIDADKIEGQITSKTKVIVPVHYAGVACDMDKIMDTIIRHILAMPAQICISIQAVARFLASATVLI